LAEHRNPHVMLDVYNGFCHLHSSIWCYENGQMEDTMSWVLGSSWWKRQRKQILMGNLLINCNFKDGDIRIILKRIFGKCSEPGLSTSFHHDTPKSTWTLHLYSHVLLWSSKWPPSMRYLYQHSVLISCLLRQSYHLQCAVITVKHFVYISYISSKTPSLNLVLENDNLN
jgi:hypothetical protein